MNCLAFGYGGGKNDGLIRLRTGIPSVPRTVLRPPSLSFLASPDDPYSPGTRAANGMIYTAGLDARGADGLFIGIGDVQEQTRQTLVNVKAVLAEAGASLEDVLKCNVYLTDMDNFTLMNEVYRRFFPSNPPARTTIETRLALPEMLVEIEAVAYCKP